MYRESIGHFIRTETIPSSGEDTCPDRQINTAIVQAACEAACLAIKFKF